MKIEGQTVVVTGGANGIGKALCAVFHREGAAKVIVADIDENGARQVAAAVDGEAIKCDVTREADIENVIVSTEARFGPIGLFCSNAGILTPDAMSQDVGQAADEIWERNWKVNVMAHIYAARFLVPRMKARGGGYFLHTASAAGLLTAVGSATYSTTKHAAIGFAENLAIAHRADGIKVSVLCPQAVDTDMARSAFAGPASRDGILSPAEVADIVIDGLARETFLILPHQIVAEYFRRKAENYDRWIVGMEKIQAKIREFGSQEPHPQERLP